MPARESRGRYPSSASDTEVEMKDTDPTHHETRVPCRPVGVGGGGFGGAGVGGGVVQARRCRPRLPPKDRGLIALLPRRHRSAQAAAPVVLHEAPIHPFAEAWIPRPNPLPP